MAKYKVRVMRTDTYYDYTEVDAESAGAAIDEVQDMLDAGGWDYVFDNDGNYQEGDYWVEDAMEVRR